MANVCAIPGTQLPRSLSVSFINKHKVPRTSKISSRELVLIKLYKMLTWPYNSSSSVFLISYIVYVVLRQVFLLVVKLTSSWTRIQTYVSFFLMNTVPHTHSACAILLSHLPAPNWGTFNTESMSYRKLLCSHCKEQIQFPECNLGSLPAVLGPS